MNTIDQAYQEMSQAKAIKNDMLKNTNSTRKRVIELKIEISQMNDHVKELYVSLQNQIDYIENIAKKISMNNIIKK